LQKAQGLDAGGGCCSCGGVGGCGETIFTLAAAARALAETQQ